MSSGKMFQILGAATLKLSTLAATSIKCVWSLEPTFPRIRTTEDLGRERPDDEPGSKAKE